MGRTIAQIQETICKALIGLPKCAGEERRNVDKQFCSKGSVMRSGKRCRQDLQRSRGLRIKWSFRMRLGQPTGANACFRLRSRPHSSPPPLCAPYQYATSLWRKLLVGKRRRLMSMAFPCHGKDQVGQAPGRSPENKVKIMKEGEGQGLMLLGPVKEGHSQR